MLILSSCASQLFAQIPFSHLETEVGMRVVRAFHRDSQGYLWIGSAGGAIGLLRYDGNTFRQYQHDPERDDSLSGNSITDIHEDSNGQLWVTTENGVNRYNRKYDSFTRYQHTENDPHSIGSNIVQQLLEEPNGRLWVRTRQSLNRYDSEEDRFDRFTLPRTQDLSTSAIVDRKGRFWVLSGGDNIFQFYPEEGRFEKSEIFTGLRSSRKKLHMDKSGGLWITDANPLNPGLYQFLPDRLSVRPFDLALDRSGGDRNAANDLLEYPEGQLLISSRGGLVLFDKESELVRHQDFDRNRKHGLSSNTLFALYEDPQGILWLGNDRSGVDVFYPSIGLIENYGDDSIFPKRSLSSSEINCIFEDREDRILIGLRGGGMSILDPNTKEILNLNHDPMDPDSLPRQQIRGIDQSSDGRIWMVTRGAGIFVFDEVDGRYQRDLVAAEKLTRYGPGQIWDIEIDRKERIWIYARGGTRELHLLSKDLELIGKFALGGVEGEVYITESSLGEILLTAEDGIYRYDETSNSVSRFLETRGVATAVAFEEESETYYVGTRDHGLFSFDRSGRRIGSYGKSEGLPSRWIDSIQAMGENSIWVSTSEGLCHFFPNERKGINYFKTDGFQGDRYAQNVSLETRKGWLYFGGFDGLSGFDPKKLSAGETPPTVTIDSIALFGTPLDHRDPEPLIDRHPQALEELILNWKQNQLSFSFSGIDLINPRKNRYAYRLEGVDEKWIHAGAYHRVASYGNLSPGSYVFRVKASNGHGVWNEEGASLAIEITPPFWQRYWFYALVGLMACASAYAFIFIRERRLRADRARLAAVVREKTKELMDHREQLEMIVENRTKELIVARDHAEESDRLKSQFLANLSHEIRTPLNAITGFTSLISAGGFEEKDRDLYSRLVLENSNSLLTLIDDILDFSLIEANQLKIKSDAFSLNEFMDNAYSSFALREENREIEHRLDNALRDEELILRGDRSRIKQVIDNLMTNAYKFTEEGFVSLSVSRNSDTIEFRVADSGPGIPEKELDLVFETFVKRQVDDLAARRGVGLGLAICKQLSQLMGGDLSVESQVGKGSTFILKLPLQLVERSEEVDGIPQGH
ncbi:ATP-binding protein [Pelagicoccus mobilis]|uniref:histidine kinase n=1 Tax=Pelagicoccus mobilis TaxID=415221 RepID=A0A934S4V9_9BACT|nr:hybrid sensor histidine kinase/response regulator [Pelagicoccus mobilis]MBK1879033.1 hypothetical protein [Pelagicoccus mobilis]